MVMRTWSGRRAALHTVGRAVKSIVLRRHMDTLGRALIGRLRLAAKEAGIPLWLNTPLQSLITDEAGAVVGIRAQRAGSVIRIRARKGVLLAAGGFEHNGEMRKHFLRDGGKDNFSAAAVENTGDGIVAGEKLGAAVDLMDDAWWMPSFHRPDGINQSAGLGALDPALDHRRPARQALHERGVAVRDVRARSAGRRSRTHLVPGLRPHGQGTPTRSVASCPGQKVPEGLAWREEHVIQTARDTIEELAAEDRRSRGRACPNRQAGTTDSRGPAGDKRDFNRGASAYDNYYGDPTLPQPTLDVLDQGPLLRAAHPGRRPRHQGWTGPTTIKAQVLRADGEPHRGPLRHRQHVGRGDGQRLRRCRRDHRSGNGVRLHRRAARGGKRLRCRIIQLSWPEKSC